MTTTHAHDGETRMVADLIKGTRVAMLTTAAPDSRLTRQPMVLQAVEFDGDL